MYVRNSRSFFLTSLLFYEFDIPTAEGRDFTIEPPTSFFFLFLLTEKSLLRCQVFNELMMIADIGRKYYRNEVISPDEENVIWCDPSKFKKTVISDSKTLSPINTFYHFSIAEPNPLFYGMSFRYSFYIKVKFSP